MKLAYLGVLAILLATVAAPQVAAQDPDTMMPDESAATAKKLIRLLTDALGGAAYLNANGSECSGRISAFGHNLDLTEFMEFKSFWRYPDTNRMEYGKKGNIIDLFSSPESWTLDHGGVSPEPEDSVAAFRENLKNNIDHLLRVRLHDPAMTFRYGGLDLIDMHPVDWVEIDDPDGRVYKLAIRRETHLLERSVVTVPDPKELDTVEFTTLYSNYHPQDGVQTPFQVSRSRNGRRISQVFYYGCKYNPSLPPDFFTKASLDQRFAEVGSKKDKESKKH
jgi:hypothetical protein